MPTILELNEQETKINNALYFMSEDDPFNPILKQQLLEIKGTEEQKLKYLTTVYLEAKTHAEGCKAVAERTAQKAKTAENKALNLKAFIRESMLTCDIKKVVGDYCTAGIQNGRESAFIPEGFDLSGLSEDFVRYYPEAWEPKKIDIKRVLKNDFKVVDDDGVISDLNDNDKDILQRLSLIRGEPIMVVR